MTSNSEIVDALKRATDFDDATVKALAGAGTLITVPAHWSVIPEQTPADKAYILLEGQVEVRKAGETVATLGPGAVIGEIALVTHKLRSASVITMTRITALHFTDEAFERVLAEHPDFGERLRTLARERLESA